MTSSFILGSVRVKKIENPNFFVFYLICLKFAIGGNFEMLITKSKPKLKLENDLSKNCNFLLILAKIYRGPPLNNSITMATVDVPWDWFVFRIQAY